jgi:HEAT repeat protein
MVFSVFVFATTLTLGTAGIAQAQDQTRAEASILADGWALLAKGDAAGAGVVAAQQLVRNQNSTGALALAVEAEIAQGGSSRGLSAYEKWLGIKRLDDAYVLRRIARVLLVEASGAKQSNVTARLEALRQLAADGDLAASATLEQAATSNGFGEARALASLGNERAVDQLIVQLNAMPGSKGPIIDALGNSGSKKAIAPLKALLTDPNDLNRASAADALGRLEATDTIPQIKPLLKDPVFIVKLKAAGALYRMNDQSGLSILMDTAASEHAAIRVAAAREMASQPDAAWQALVRSLANDSDPTVRLEVARLIAPYDLILANTILDALMRDSNIGVREAASGILVERVAADLATLRGLLKSGDLTVRVKAAGRLLELTR